LLHGFQVGLALLHICHVQAHVHHCFLNFL
jgi:hypothetical protein